MPKSLILDLDGKEFEVLITRIDREDLYGSVEVEAFDEKGKPAELKVLAADGKTLIDKGGTALTVVNEKGDSIERSELVAVDLDGDEITKVESSFNAPNKLKKAEVDDYLGLVVKSVYLLDSPEDGDLDYLLEHLSSNKMYTFPFSYRGGLEHDAAYIVGGDKDEAFMIIGKDGDLDYVKLNQAGVLSSNEEQEISADDISFDLL
ncbi:MAG TPA: hypothetical protein VJL58_10765 [Pyrinomonadaceae bacterium]|nr:hypothetical protein [Pyrinomonadaceae bacterium]